MEWLKSSKECVFLGLLVASLLEGLQSSKGYISAVPRMQLSGSRSLAYQTLYNHPKDTFLHYYVRRYRSPGRWPIGQSKIIYAFLEYGVIIFFTWRDVWVSYQITIHCLLPFVKTTRNLWSGTLCLAALIHCSGSKLWGSRKIDGSVWTKYVGWWPGCIKPLLGCLDTHSTIFPKARALSLIRRSILSWVSYLASASIITVASLFLWCRQHIPKILIR